MGHGLPPTRAGPSRALLRRTGGRSRAGAGFFARAIDVDMSADARAGCTCTQVDTAELVETLRSQGANLPQETLSHTMTRGK